MAVETLPATGRQCDGCTLCCKLLGIAEIEKPRGVWCKKCEIDVGCTIHPSRPKPCRNFFCGYLTRPALGEHWRPSVSGMIVVWGLEERSRIAINVDPDRADAWRQEPYYSEIMMWAMIYPATEVQIIIYTGQHVIAVMHDREIDLGILPEEDIIVTELTPSPTGFRANIFAVPPDDPRVAGIVK